MIFSDLFAMAFMRNAFLAATAIAVAGSLVGYFVVLRRQTFAAHALAHVGFAGAAGATLIGVSPLYGLLAFISMAALALSVLGADLRDRDVSVGMVLMFSLALGLLFLNLYSANANAALGILFGSVVGISAQQAQLTALISSLVVLFLLGLFRPLRFASIYETAARARGIPVTLVGAAFMLTLGLALAVAVPVIGVLLSFAIFVGPAASAQLWTGRVSSGLLLTVVFAVTQTWCGLIASYYIGYPATTWIAGLSFALWLCSSSLLATVARVSRA